jgi:non-structural maintenance of chromosomes element 1
LELYIRRTFQDEVIDCTLCEQLLTLGYTCASNHPDHPAQDPCGTHIHKHCFASHRQHSAKCLACDIDWSKQGGVKHIGEEGAMDGFDDNLRRRRQSEANDALEAESDEDIDDGPSQTSRPKGKERPVRKSQLTLYAPIACLLRSVIVIFKPGHKD